VSTQDEEALTVGLLKSELEKIIGKQAEVGWTIACERKGKFKVKLLTCSDTSHRTLPG
jgi:hypothetical protein